MTALETAFLALESREVPFVFACVLELDRPIDVAPLRAYVDAALRDHPRYRQRIARARLGNASWTADQDFRIDRHVRAATLAAPGGARELEELVAELLASELPRDHAPWRMWTVGGLERGRGAVIVLVHHALVDGIAGIRLLEQMLGAPASSPPPAPREAQGPRARVRDLLAWHHVRGLARLLRDGLSPASDIGLNPRLGATRAFASFTVSLADVRHIEDTFGVTNNDVVLAIVAGALRRYVSRHGVALHRARDVRAMVPVGRHARDRDTAGNRVALLLAPLPIHLADADRRLARIARRTRALKRERIASGGDLLVALGDATTPQVLSGVLRLALRLRAFNTIVTNVPGPRAQLSLLGARVERIVPVVNLWPRQALGVAVASYAGALTFGLNADRAAIDLAALREDFAAACEELAQVSMNDTVPESIIAS